MKLRKFFIPFTIIASLGALVLTGCNRHSHDPEEKAEWIVHKISKKLDLNDEQKAKLEDVKTELLNHHNNNQQRHMAMMDSLIAEVKKPEIDQSVLLDIVNQHKSEVGIAAPAVIEKLALFHASLNDEQKQELVKKLEKFKERHHHS